jgi:hypothetical protein
VVLDEALVLRTNAHGPLPRKEVAR